MISSQNINSLFNPNSVAIVGASTDLTKLGSVILKNIIDAGFKGDIYPVNPKYESVLDRKSYPKVSDIPEPVDLVVVVIPSQFILETIKDAADAGAKNAIIISAGFAEKGAEGKALEREIADYANAKGMRIVGPNCLGVISTEAKLNASFASHFPSDGNVAFLSQSGAFNTALLDLSITRGLGFKYFVSLGNKSDIDELSLLKAWLYDEKVKVIGIYIEQFTSGIEFMQLIESSPKKPIILLHSGKTKEGKSAASSHTGSMTSASDVVNAALIKLGVVQVNSIEKLFNTLTLFSWIDDIPKGQNVAVVTNAGGPGIMITDMFVATGISMPAISETTQKKLAKFLPPQASLHNPVDVLGDANAERFDKAIGVLVEDKEIAIVVPLLTPQYVTEIYETSRVIINHTKSDSKPIIPVFIGEYDIIKGLSLMWKNKIPAFQFAEEAVASINSLVRYVQFQDINQNKDLQIKKLQGQYEQELVSHLDEVEKALPESLVRQLAVEAGIELPREKVVTTVEEALAFAESIDFPVVIKASTEDAVHKTDTSLIFLDIKTKSDLIVKYSELTNNLNAVTGKSGNHPILIQEMVKGEEELIIGAKRDGSSEVLAEDKKGFGYLLMFGKGGIYTEVYKDLALDILPMSDKDIEALIDSTKVSLILHGTRGKKALAVEKVKYAIKAIQKLLFTYPAISSIDINPLMVTEDRCVAVDVKLFVKR